MASTETNRPGVVERMGEDVDRRLRLVADAADKAGDALGARFPLRLLRPAAWRLRAPHRIGSGRRGSVEAI
jgi:hypothetical protein